MSNTRFRIGMVGAGKSCEFHVAAVKQLASGGADLELVGITDLDAARARERAEQWGTTAYADLEALVAAGANVIHVLTPPASHAAIAIMALKKNCHVLIDEPITADPEEARQIGVLAKQKRLTVGASHSLLFDPQVKQALDAVRSGELGDLVSVEILRVSEYPSFEGGTLPPWYRDAGYAFAELGVPCMYLLQELLGPIEDVDGQWTSLGGDPNLPFDDWRVSVRCKRGLGQIRLSWSSKPMQSQIVITGTRGARRVDLLAMFDGTLPRAAERLVNAFAESIRKVINVPINVWKFVRKEMSSSQGLRDLIADFYRRLAGGEPPTVTVEEARDVVHFVQKIAQAAEAEHAARLATFTRSDTVAFLVTGASGNVGKATVKRLLADGHRVRVMVRRIPEQPLPNVEYCFGNLGDRDAVDRAVQGAEVVIHLGAATKGGWPEHKVGTVIGTQNVLHACQKYGTKQLVYISSMSVVDWAGSVGKGSVTEAAELEPRPDERGAYTRAKLEAERLVVAAAAQGLPCVILRPGQIFGGGIPLINGAVARNAGGR
ncbi:MAG: NAD-dependent epimerase/dehydratase family protein, partial [Deltaproteobacteria bacterium]|nr:NAD-dependent epimerase/dehydratase family protein [Deltaproteobacteria bacterium]